MTSPFSRVGISFLGLGLMGEPIVRRILDDGKHHLTLWNRSPAKVLTLKEEHQERVQVAPDACSAVRANEIVCLFLFDAHSIQELLEQLKIDPSANFKGRTFIVHSTVGPEDIKGFAQTIETNGGTLLEAPVLGNALVAAAGKLQLLLGSRSTDELPAPLRELFSLYCTSINRVGDIGSASVLKLALNQYILSHLSSFATSFAMCERGGVESNAFVSILGNWLPSVPNYNIRFQNNMSNRKYDSKTFSLDGAHKDLELAVSLQKQLGVASTFSEGNLKLFQEAKALHQSMGELDFTSVYEAVNPRPDS